MHFPDRKGATRWEYVIFKDGLSAPAGFILKLPFPSIQEMLQHHPHRVELVIELRFFSAPVHTGGWGGTACLAAPPVQEDSTWSKAEARVY